MLLVLPEMARRLANEGFERKKLTNGIVGKVRDMNIRIEDQGHVVKYDH